MPVVTLREKIFYLLKKKSFAYAVDSEGLVAADLLGCRGFHFLSGSANVLFLRHVAGGQCVGSEAPTRSLHATFIGLSEAIFQNWLHLQTYWGIYILCAVPERGGPLGLCVLWGSNQTWLEEQYSWQALSAPQVCPALRHDQQVF